MSITSTLEAQPHISSYVDPVGTLYESGDALVRGIRSEFAEFYANLLEKPTVRGMIGRQIIDTEISAAGLPGYPLTLQHRRIYPLSYCYEWPAPMLRDAALLTLEISQQLINSGLALKDASPWNVVFEGPRPLFVDFTSIVPEDPHLPWIAYDQFCRLFLHPLMLFRFQPGRVVRALLLDSINGISDAELIHLLPTGAWLRLPQLISRTYLPRLLLAVLRRLSSDKALTKISARMAPTPAARQAFFLALYRDVKAIPSQTGRSRWSSYYSDIGSFLRPANFNLKQTTVAQILERYRPRTVVDLGCNTGGYSILATRVGARVTAFDSDEISVGLLYELAHREELNILPLVMDLLNPSPACGWQASQYPAAPQRLGGEMALALALVHHLAISQRQTFERIIPALASYTKKWLLTEFVPLEDPRSCELLATHRRDMSWYSLDGFIAALKSVFPHVEIFPSYPDGRVLVLAAR